MKKTISKILIIIIVVSSMAAVFSGCYKQFQQFEYEEVDNEIVIKFYNDASTVFEVSIPETIDGKPVTKIAPYSICDTNYLKKLTISKNIREIDNIAIKNNTNVDYIDVDPENEYFKSVDGVLYTKDGKEVVAYPIRKDIKIREKIDEKTKEKVKEEYIANYTIPDGCEIIRPYAFYHVKALEEIIMPDSVKIIGEAAFMMDSASLKKVTLSKNLETISKDSFSKNWGLTELLIHNKITKIEGYAFFNCPILKNIKICQTEANIQFGERWKPSNQGTELKAFDPKKNKEEDRKKFLDITYGYDCGQNHN